jgi:cytochrome b561
LLRNTAAGWGSVAKFLHWTVAALVLGQMILGWWAVRIPLSPRKLDLFVWHKSVGMTILVLVAVRLAWRVANPSPALPAFTPAWERLAARVVHALLYALLIAMSLSGWVVNSAANVPFRVFWLIPLPPLVGPDREVAELFSDVHLLVFVALSLSLLLHVAAAIRHHVVLRDDVLTRMLPVRRQSR